jgi:hypothetical protein
MTLRHCYLLVEGQQDVVFVGRMLEELGLASAERAGQIPDRWEPYLDKAARQRDDAERAAGRIGVPFWQIFKPACLLKPGSTIQLSVLRDRWVSGATLSLPRVAAIADFIKSLCDIT